MTTITAESGREPTEDRPDGAATAVRDRRSEGGSDFARLSRRIKQAGLLERSPVYYAVRAGVIGLAFAAGWTAFFLLGDSWWQVLVAVFLAAVFGQCGLLAHELAHRQIFAGRQASELAGRLVGNLGVGMAYGWWQDKHTRHHANPNHEDLDPDVGMEIFVWSTEQAEKATGPARIVGRWQAWLFYPLLTLEGMNLHAQSVRALFQPRMKQRLLEAALLFTHFAAYLSALFVVLPPGKALVFMAIHQGLFGVYLGIIFAPNHKGMPTLRGETRLDFLRKQVLTSRNVRGGWFTDIALGGLNYQIEHHLFPSMTAPQLRRAQPIVRDFCAEAGVDYCETGFLESHAEALRHLHRAGAPLRSRSRVPAAPES